jgi:hypothetical protein
MSRLLRFAPLVCLFVAPDHALGGEPADKAPADVIEVRMLDREGRLLLSRGEQPLAVAQVRNAAEPALPVLTLEQACALLKPGDGAKKALSSESEQVRELRHEFPV